MKETKLVNYIHIMKEIWINESISRIDIAKNIKIDKSTVTLIIKDLIQKNIVIEHEEGKASSSGGRKPVFLKLNHDIGYVLGIELQRSFYRIVVVDLSGNIIHTKKDRIVIEYTNITDVLSIIINDIFKIQTKFEVPLIGIGIGISGIVDNTHGRVLSSLPFNIYDTVDLNKELSKHFDIPIYVDNDANCCIWGEMAFFRRQQHKNYIYIMLETRSDEDLVNKLGAVSLGVGIVIDGKVHYGENFSAGEFHSILKNSKDHYGQFAITKEEHRKFDIDKKIQKEFFHELAKHIALFVNVFDFATVFLGGDFKSFNIFTIDIINEEIQKNWPYHSNKEVNIQFSSFAEDAVCYGAAGMILNKLFSRKEGVKSKSKKDSIHKKIGLV